MTQKEISSQVKAIIDSFIVDQKIFSASRASIVHQVQDDSKYIKPVFDHIYDIITSSKRNGVEKFLSLRLLKDCLDFGTEEAINYAAKKFLKKLSGLAEALFATKNTKDRAKVLGVTEYPEASGNFQALVLECLCEWPKLFGAVNQEYTQTYNSLVKKGVKFSETKTYFKGTSAGKRTAEPEKKTPETLRSSSVGGVGRQSQENVGKKQDSRQLVQMTEMLLEEMLGTRKALTETLFSNQMEKEVIEIFLEQIKSTNSQLKSAALELTKAQTMKNTPLVEEAFKECGLATDISQALEKYIKVTNNYNLLKTEVADFISKSNVKDMSHKEESKAPAIDNGSKSKTQQVQRSSSEIPQNDKKLSKGNNAPSDPTKSIFGSSEPNKQPNQSTKGYNFEGWDQPQSGERASQKQANFSDVKADQKGKQQQGPEALAEKKTFGFDDFDNDADFDDFPKEEEKKQQPEKNLKRGLVPTTNQNEKSKEPPARVQLKAKDDKEEGIIITHDPKAFSGFNFGDPTPPNESNSKALEKGGLKSENISKPPSDTNKRPDSAGKQQTDAPIEKKQSAVISEVEAGSRIDTNINAEKKEQKQVFEAKDFGFDDFNENENNAPGGFKFEDFVAENDFFGFENQEKQGAQNNTGGTFFTTNADFFTHFTEPGQQSGTKDQISKHEEESKQPPLRDPEEQKLKEDKRFSFQDALPARKPIQSKGVDELSDNPGQRNDNGKFGLNHFGSILNSQQIPPAREESLVESTGVKKNILRENNFFGAFENQFEQHSNAKAEPQSNQALEIPKDLGNKAFANSALKLLLTSHIENTVKIESEKAKQERDRAVNDLLAVKEMYNEIKSHFEKMRNEQMQMSGSYGKVKEELSTLSQINKLYGSEFKKLRHVAEEQRKEKINLRQEAEQQLLKSQPITKQITDLKQQLTKADSQERKNLIQSKIAELERQLESNKSYLQTVGAMLQAAETEDKEQIEQMRALSSIVETSPAKSSPSKYSSPSPTRQPNENQKSTPREKAIDDIIRVKEFQNPVLLNAVNLLKASRQMREQDLKALASGQIPKLTNPPAILRGPTPTRVFRDELSRVSVVSRNNVVETPSRSRASRYNTVSAMRERFSAAEVGGNERRFSANPSSPGTRRQKNEELIPSNYQPKIYQPQADSENIPPPALPIYHAHRQESRRESHRPDSRRESYKPEPRSESQPKPVFDNPVLRQVSDLLDRSKKLRIDHSKFSHRREYDTSFQRITTKHSEKLAPGTSYQGPMSPRLSAIDLNRDQRYTQEARHVQEPERKIAQYFRGISENRERSSQRPPDYENTSQLFNNYNDRSRGYSPNPRSTYRLSQTSYNNPEESHIFGIPERSSILNAGEDLRNSQFIPDLQAGKRKSGRFISYSGYVFERMAREIESNQYIKDLDLFRYACLASKSALVDSPILQIGVISHLKTNLGSYGNSQAIVLLHYSNKTINEFYSFSVSLARLKDIRANTDVIGVQIASRYQLKQEFVQDFKDFTLGLHQIDVTFMHNSTVHTFTVPIPFSLTKFMEFKYINLLTFKNKWKSLKFDCIKLPRRKLNPKIFKDLSDLNRFFNGLIIDTTSLKARSQKVKYAGCFKLPDNYEYFLKFNVGTKGCKFSIVTENPNKTNAEISLQQLAFLLTTN